MKHYAIIVAGGTGTRMGADKPKQFIEIHQKPILIHTLTHFIQALPDIQIVVVTHPEWKDFTQYIIQQHLTHFLEKIHLVTGGKTRFESVKNGLKSLTDAQNGYVAVHDAVRCCIKPDDIEQAFIIAKQKGNCLVCTTPKESLRKIHLNNTQAVPRHEYLIVQTPQIFNLKDMLNVYLQHVENEPNSITDDASLMEKYGHHIHVLLIADHNIKITTPQDLALARYLLEERNGF
ncbi:MAG: 2-C-methyl-D-erythritol 4-phosphate cytidylyltransferase [Bacteroidia bacterium]|nr:2-C-methyl-D-erythritol 4-phosphate cytidylyltransferase [Bacteroidia bacterium]MDW8346497.1 2-C-methyl-D-erythritol 4-phosphate cytidylyltransferase [Bacteroidia bacterium]